MRSRYNLSLTQRRPPRDTEARSCARPKNSVSGSGRHGSPSCAGEFVDGPVLVMPGAGGGLSNSLGAVVIPDVGTIYFGAYRMTGAWGTLEADKGVLVAAPGWVVREGARRGDYELIRQQP